MKEAFAVLKSMVETLNQRRIFNGASFRSILNVGLFVDRLDCVLFVLRTAIGRPKMSSKCWNVVSCGEVVAQLWRDKSASSPNRPCSVQKLYYVPVNNRCTVVTYKTSVGCKLQEQMSF